MQKVKWEILEKIARTLAQPFTINELVSAIKKSDRRAGTVSDLKTRIAHWATKRVRRGRLVRIGFDRPAQYAFESLNTTHQLEIPNNVREMTIEVNGLLFKVKLLGRVRPAIPYVDQYEASRVQFVRNEEQKHFRQRVDFIRFINKNPNFFVTQHYRLLGLSGYKGDKLKRDCIGQGLVQEVNTRDGKAGRLAKRLTLTEKGADMLARSKDGTKIN